MEASGQVKGTVNPGGREYTKEITADHYRIFKIILCCHYYSCRSSVRLRSGSKLSNDFVPAVLSDSVKMFADQGITQENVLCNLYDTLTITIFHVQMKWL